MAGPLDGLQVIEMAGIGPCPLAGQLLADLGADVIVIDRASAKADPTDVNRRGKRSIALNLKTDQGRDLALRLIDRAGVVIEGFRPGVMEKLGLGPAACGPHVIYGRMTGWGQSGPLAHTAGHDLNYIALTGALAAIGPRDAPPPPPLNLIGDYGGGTMFLLLGVLSALYERSRSGQGQVIDAAMVDGASAMMGLFQTLAARGQWTAERHDNMLDGGAPFYRCYETADGLFMSVGALEPQFHAEFLRIAGLPAEHSRDQYDKTRWAERAEAYAARFREKSQSEWTRMFTGSDACVAPVLDMEGAAGDPHMAGRGVFMEVSGVRQTAPAPRFSRSAPAAPAAPRAAGVDAESILAEIGELSDAANALRQNRVLT